MALFNLLCLPSFLNTPLPPFKFHNTISLTNSYVSCKPFQEQCEMYTSPNIQSLFQKHVHIKTVQLGMIFTRWWKTEVWSPMDIFITPLHTSGYFPVQYPMIYMHVRIVRCEHMRQHVISGWLQHAAASPKVALQLPFNVSQVTEFLHVKRSEWTCMLISNLSAPHPAYLIWLFTQYFSPGC